MTAVNNTFIQLPLLLVAKACNRCHVEKPLSEFPTNPSSRDGRKSICKVCDSATTKARRQANPERLKAIARASYQRCIAHKRAYNAAHHEQRRTYYRARYTNDPEYRQRYREYQARYVSLHRDMANAAQRAWKEAHPRKGTEYTMSYNARKRGVTVEDVDYTAILERDGMHCYICEQSILEHHRIAFDHVIPITRDGIHAASNIKVTHLVCNSRKHNKLLEEMTPFQRRGLDY